ncbi:MAG: glycosyltransferase family 4 protein [Pseudomonadota bacterium]
MSSAALTVDQFANTFVGRPGNIGVRTAKVLRELVAAGGGGSCYCRGADERISGVEYVDMGLLGHVPRLLNAFRIYIAPRFDHRPADIALFERFSIGNRHCDRSESMPRIAHVWDYCPRLIEQLKSNGVRVVLDVPVAPAAYTLRMRDGGARFLVVHQRHVEIESKAFAAADHLIAPSEFVAEELMRVGVPRERIAVIEFGVDSVPHGKSAGSGRFDGSGLAFCFAGTVNRRKGVAELLAAWSDERFRQDSLHLCGRLFPDAQRLLATAGGGQVVAPGFVSTFDYFSNCDVFVFPSWLEGSAKAVFEAMACGLPAIVTRSAGSVVRDGVEGFVIEAGDVDALRARMLWFKDNPGQVRIMGEAARRRAAEFSWTRYAGRVLDIYRGLA